MPARRDTEQQRAIRTAFENAGRPLSVDEVHRYAREHSPTLGLSTVYRAISRLSEDGTLVPVSVPGQPDRHELASSATEHHHHFHCESCDRVFDVHACPGGLANMLPSGFELTGHELSLKGRCIDCATE